MTRNTFITQKPTRHVVGTTNRFRPEIEYWKGCASVLKAADFHEPMYDASKQKAASAPTRNVSKAKLGSHTRHDIHNKMLHIPRLLNAAISSLSLDAMQPIATDNFPLVRKTPEWSDRHPESPIAEETKPWVKTADCRPHIPTGRKGCETRAIGEKLLTQRVRGTADSR